jgi:hypothetical protein
MLIEKFANKRLLAAETGQQGHIYVRRLPWFAPTLQGQTANDAGVPTLRTTEGLKFRGGTDNFNHGRQPF